jgi:hypothetical protein
MIARRFALATLVAAGALAIAGCGMMDKMTGSMSVPLSGQNEVPPNASTGSGTAKLDLDGTTLKWTVTYSGTTGPVTAGHLPRPRRRRCERRRRRAVHRGRWRARSSARRR